MEAVVLAGGQGMRLRKAVPNLPKSLATVGEHPFLNYLLGWLRTQGITEIILALGYRRQTIARHYAKNQPAGLHLRYSVESAPLGTAGALLNLRSILDGEEFLVLNGDSIFDVDLIQMLAFHRRHCAEVTLALASPDDQGRYGSVVLDARKRIKSFLEKRSLPRQTNSTNRPRWINGGLYVMNKAIFRHMPEKQKVSLEKDVFPRLIGHPFYGFPWKGYFIDIGIPEDYQRAQAEVPERFVPC